MLESLPNGRGVLEVSVEGCGPVRVGDALDWLDAGVAVGELVARRGELVARCLAAAAASSCCCLSRMASKC